MGKVVIGVDPHKKSNTLVVIDTREQVLAEQRFVNDRPGYRAMKAFVRAFTDRTWAVEGARGVGAGLAQRLVAEGEPVLNVPVKLSARVRALGGGSGRKTDSADALAVAVAGLRAVNLQPVRPDDAVEIWDADRPPPGAGARADLHGEPAARGTGPADPGGARKNLRASTARTLLSTVRPRAAVAKARKQLALDYIGDLERLEVRLKELKTQIADTVAEQHSSLTDIVGVGPLGPARSSPRSATSVGSRPSRFARQHRTGRRVLRGQQPAPAQPRRQPAAQPRPARRRGHPGPDVREGRDTPAQARSRHDPPRGARAETRECRRYPRGPGERL